MYVCIMYDIIIILIYYYYPIHFIREHLPATPITIILFPLIHSSYQACFRFFFFFFFFSTSREI